MNLTNTVVDEGEVVVVVFHRNQRHITGGQGVDIYSFQTYQVARNFFDAQKTDPKVETLVLKTVDGLETYDNIRP